MVMLPTNGSQPLPTRGHAAHQRERASSVSKHRAPRTKTPTYLRPYVSRLTLQTSAPRRTLQGRGQGQHWPGQRPWAGWHPALCRDTAPAHGHLPWGRASR